MKNDKSFISGRNSSLWWFIGKERLIENNMTGNIYFASGDI
jgi:hypothetical protein